MYRRFVFWSLYINNINIIRGVAAKWVYLRICLITLRSVYRHTLTPVSRTQSSAKTTEVNVYIVFVFLTWMQTKIDHFNAEILSNTKHFFIVKERFLNAPFGNVAPRLIAVTLLLQCLCNVSDIQFKVATTLG